MVRAMWQEMTVNFKVFTTLLESHTIMFSWVRTALGLILEVRDH